MGYRGRLHVIPDDDEWPPGTTRGWLKEHPVPADTRNDTLRGRMRRFGSAVLGLAKKLIGGKAR